MLENSKQLDWHLNCSVPMRYTCKITLRYIFRVCLILFSAFVQPMLTDWRLYLLPFTVPHYHLSTTVPSFRRLISYYSWLTPDAVNGTESSCSPLGNVSRDARVAGDSVTSGGVPLPLQAIALSSFLCDFSSAPAKLSLHSFGLLSSGRVLLCIQESFDRSEELDGCSAVKRLCIGDESLGTILKIPTNGSLASIGWIGVDSGRPTA